MLFPIFLATVTQGALQAQPIVCPITNEPVAPGSKVTEYNGIRFTYCCPGCDKTFEKDPQGTLDRAVKAGKTIGVFLFDPVSAKRIDSDKASGGTEDYKSIRYYFASPEDKAAFDKQPAKFAAIPKEEALHCPVTKTAVETYSQAEGYGDYNGVRYYFCCPGCDKPFTSDPVKYAQLANSYVRKPVAKTQASAGGKK
jgi:YHS domain-containing protein